MEPLNPARPDRMSMVTISPPLRTRPLRCTDVAARSAASDLDTICDADFAATPLFVGAAEEGAVEEGAAEGRPDEAEPLSDPIGLLHAPVSSTADVAANATPSRPGDVFGTATPVTKDRPPWKYVR